MNEEQLENFLSTETPYHFTIHNECSELASASINLESLTVSGKALEDEYIDAILYEDDYNSNLNRIKKLSSDILNDENKVIIDAKHAYSLYSFNLKPDEVRDFNLLLYMDPDTPMVEANMNASWKGKITLSTGYKEDSKALRKILSSDTNGMWGYKDKLTKIVIENTKSVKTAEDGGKVYGPFDESEYGTKAVESYVVCEADDVNCVAYLQSNGKVVANSDSSNLFYGFSKVTSIEKLENLDTSKVINMSNMFSGSNFNTLDVSSLDTGKVENMAAMFRGMRNLESIDLHTFNTNSLNNIDGMFSGSNLLTTLDLSTFNTEKLSSVRNLVGGCDGLTEINLSNWKFNDRITSNFSLTSSISTCPQLEKIILENVDTSQVSNMSNMLSGVSKISTIDLSDFDTRNVTNMSGMFSGDSGLQSIDLSNFDTSKVINMSGMFTGLSKITTLDLSDFDTEQLTNANGMFSADKNLQKLDLSNWKFNDNITLGFWQRVQLNTTPLNTLILKNVDTSSVTNMSQMFSGNSNLINIDLSDFDTSNVNSISSLFDGSNSLQEINLSNWKFNDNMIKDFANSTKINKISSLKSIIFNNVDTSEVTDMSKMFFNCTNLVSLDLSSFDTSKVENMTQMFNGTPSLQHITFGPNFVYKQGASLGGMFAGCSAPERPTGDTWTDVSF